MDKSAIRNFAVSARGKLKEQIEQKAYTFGITKNEIKNVEVFEDTFEVNGNKYDKTLFKHRDSLVKNIKTKDFEQVIEEVTYTWFNRLITIRFMEVNEYLPSGVRVLSSTDSSKVEPDIIREAANLDFEDLNIGLIYKLQGENNTEELFKYLLIKQCNELGKIMPMVFKEIEDFTELLLPDNLLQEESIIRALVTSITEEDFKEQVEIIGWLYQYYISEKKDEVFADLKKNKKITKENIPAATQLFTPDWIVKYLVENSLGRLWLESYPNKELKAKWEYYLEEAEQEPEVIIKLEIIRDKNKALKPEGIKFLDPSMGSGHILVYAFDVLFDIYKSAGYSEREIPKLILTKNIYGLDIDDRVAQLAYFAVMMKARSYNSRIFREKIDFNICSFQESNDFTKEAIEFLVSLSEPGEERRTRRDAVEYLINVFNDAKDYGSILEVDEINFEAIERILEEIRKCDTTDIFQWEYKNIILEKMPRLIKQAKIMSQKYDVVCTNPPYMASKGMGDKLSIFVKEKFQSSKGDLFAIFIERGFDYLNRLGFNAMVTMQSWMFLSSYVEMRIKLIQSKDVITLLHMDNMVMDIAFGTVATVFRNTNVGKYKGCYSFISQKDISENKPFEFPVKNKRLNYLSTDEFKIIPGHPFAYWISERVRNIFKYEKTLGEIEYPKQGLITANNDRFLKYWFEVDNFKIGFGFINREEAKNSKCKWFPYNKGGEYRKWYGNNEYVINWESDGFEIKNYRNEDGKKLSRTQNLECFFLEGITWSQISNGKISVRYSQEGHIFDARGSSVFPSKDILLYLLAFMCSNIAYEFLEFLSPTISFEIGNVALLPIIYSKNKNEIIQKISLQNIQLVKSDWDSFENSWNFSKHPFLNYLGTKNNICAKLETVFIEWSKFRKKQFDQLKHNEEELNKIFIEIYGLQDEITSQVDEKHVSIRKAERTRDIKSFISYSVGCMFGRYSLDEDGVIYAGGEFNSARYKTFKVDLDNVIPVTDDEYFKNDIVCRLVEFVKITFGEKTLEENLAFIADTLGKKVNETPRQRIRRYFLKDFYKDHVHYYQKRPIYWLFDSGKNYGFRALIYMHRYDNSTVAKVRNDYLHLLQRIYEAEINRLDMIMENSNALAREKIEARKKKEKIQRQILECNQYDQVIAYATNQKINIELDDGIIINYGKFQEIEVPQGKGKKPLKADLLAKI